MREELYENDAEKRRHLNAMHVIETRTGAPHELVVDLYEKELGRLKVRARIKDFLSVLASREVMMEIRGGAGVLHH